MALLLAIRASRDTRDPEKGDINNLIVRIKLKAYDLSVK